MLRDDPPPRVVQAVLAQKPFEGVSPQVCERVAAALTWAELPQGSVFLVEGNPPDDLFFVIDGEVSLTRARSILAILPSPAVIGLLSVLDGQPRSASAQAFTDCVVACLSADAFDDLVGASPRFVRNLVQHVAVELRDIMDRNREIASQFADAYESPNARLAPGPYHVDRFDQYVFVVDAPSAELENARRDLVAPLPGLEGHYLLTFGRCPRVYSTFEGRVTSPVSYDEAAYYLPGLGPEGHPVLFCPEQYVENYMAVSVGRELYGFPRRYGRIEFRDTSIDLDVEGAVVARAAWAESRLVDAGEFVDAAIKSFSPQGSDPRWLESFRSAVMGLAQQHLDSSAVPVLVQNQVPSTFLTAGRELRINELVEVPLIVSRLHNLALLDGAVVRFFGPEPLPVGRCYGGFRLSFDLTFGLPRKVRELPTVGSISLARQLWADVKTLLP